MDSDPCRFGGVKRVYIHLVINCLIKGIFIQKYTHLNNLKTERPFVDRVIQKGLHLVKTRLIIAVK